jgi:hypothetical protein
MAKQLYEGSIDEFTDWVTGIDSITEENITGGNEVSGKSIREYL